MLWVCLVLVTCIVLVGVRFDLKMADIHLLISYATIRLGIRSFVKSKRTTVDLFYDQIHKNPDKVAVEYKDKRYSYRELHELSNRVANWALAEGFRKWDVIGLIMSNRLEYVIIWLGLAKIGVTTALINTNLKKQGLSHCIKVSQCRAIIFDEVVKQQVRELRGEWKLMKMFYLPEDCEDAFPEGEDSLQEEKIKDLQSLLQDAPTTAISPTLREGLDSSDVLFYIFTSGTTGFPKAAKIRHTRFFLAGLSFSTIFRVNSSDRIYCCLPIYHSSGGMLAVSMCWYQGATLILAKKFSASRFFQECYEKKVTVAVYIGQICRYLVNTAPTKYDKIHCIRKVIGNGLRADTWKEFIKRFNIPQVCEFYASTEGNTPLFNVTNTVGSCGYLPRWCSIVFPMRLVKYDVEEEKILFGENGRIIECDYHESGQLIGQISESDVLRKFDGYNNKSATKKVILRDVFRPGDKWFKSGDLLIWNKRGHFYFVDRSGDTFRWKAENVSTNEVAQVIQAFPAIEEVIVYGVKAPHNDGKAGMACVVVKQQHELDFDLLCSHLRKSLPKYACPLFWRLRDKVDVTTTFKHKKVSLVNEGFDPEVVEDKLYFYDQQKGTCVELSDHVFQLICEGTILL